MLPLFILFVSVVSAQKIVKVEKATNYSVHVFSKDFEGVIFSKEYNSEWLKFERVGRIYAADISYANNQAAAETLRFTPTIDEINLTEDILASGLKKVNRKLPHVRFVAGPNVYRHLKYYKRQYFGFLLKNNEKVVMINCFWSDLQKLDTEWLENYYQVFDGGNYYWTIKINLTTHQLFDFGVNGVI